MKISGKEKVTTRGGGREKPALPRTSGDQVHPNRIDTRAYSMGKGAFRNKPVRGGPVKGVGDGRRSFYTKKKI